MNETRKARTKARSAGVYDGWHEAGFVATYGYESGARGRLAAKYAEQSTSYAEGVAEGWKWFVTGREIIGRPQRPGWEIGLPYLDTMVASLALSTQSRPLLHADETPMFQPVSTDEGYLYEPWTDGWAVGFKITHPETGQARYVMLNPSSSDETSVAVVFVYEHSQPDVAAAEPLGYCTPFTGGTLHHPAHEPAPHPDQDPLWSA